MTHWILKILPIIFLFFSCQQIDKTSKPDNNQKTSVLTPEQYEEELIMQTLPTLCKLEFKEGDYRYYYRTQKRLDSATFTLCLYLLDTLLVPDKRALYGLNDTSFNGLGKYLLSDTLIPKKIDLDKIEIPLRFELLKNKPIYKYIDDWNDGFVGFVNYSRIIFNGNYTQALFYFEYSCGGLCGFGATIYTEKKDGKWMVVGYKGSWVS